MRIIRQLVGLLRGPAETDSRRDPDWDPSQRARVVAHMKRGVVLTFTPLASPCPLCGQLIANSYVRTDGFEHFGSLFMHQVEHDDLRPPDRFIQHVLRYPAAISDELERYRALEEVREGPLEEAERQRHHQALKRFQKRFNADFRVRD